MSFSPITVWKLQGFPRVPGKLRGHLFRAPTSVRCCLCHGGFSCHIVVIGLDVGLLH